MKNDKEREGKRDGGEEEIIQRKKIRRVFERDNTASKRVGDFAF